MLPDKWQKGSSISSSMQHVVFFDNRITVTDCKTEAVAWKLEAMQHQHIARLADLKLDLQHGK